MKTIQFDVDGVLADFCLGFTKLGRRLFGEEIQLVTTHECPTWASLGTNREQTSEIWKYIEREPNFWLSLTSLVSEEVFRQINALNAEHHVVFVTHRTCGFPSPQYQTGRWLEMHGIVRPSVVLSRNKGHIAAAIKADYSIEDTIENANNVAILGDPCKSYLINRPYNQDEDEVCPVVIRLNTVSEFLAEVQ